NEAGADKNRTTQTRSRRVETVQLRQENGANVSRSADFGKNGIRPDQVANQAALDNDNKVVVAEEEYVKTKKADQTLGPQKHDPGTRRDALTPGGSPHNAQRATQNKPAGKNVPGAGLPTPASLMKAAFNPAD